MGNLRRLVFVNSDRHTIVQSCSGLTKDCHLSILVNIRRILDMDVLQSGVVSASDESQPMVIYERRPRLFV